MSKITTTAIAVASFIILVTLFSCGSKKTIAVEAGGHLKSKTQEQLLTDVLTHELKYKTITTKGKVSINGKEFTAIYKLIKDDIIQVSVRPVLGIEAGRIDITPDKTVLIDRLGGRYAELDMKNTEITETFAFNFSNLQALLTNQLFLAGNKKVDKSNFDKYLITAMNDTYLLITRDKNDLSYNFIVDATDRITSTSIMHEASKTSLKWSYENFVEDNQAIYPTSMTGNIQVKKRTFKVGVSYSDLAIDTDFNVDRSIPSRYKKINLIDLLDVL